MGNTVLVINKVMNRLPVIKNRLQHYIYPNMKGVAMCLMAFPPYIQMCPE